MPRITWLGQGFSSRGSDVAAYQTWFVHELAFDAGAAAAE